MNYQQSAQKKPIAAAILSIIAGVIGLIISLMMVVLILYAIALVGSMGGIGGIGGIVGGFVAIAMGLAIWLLIASILVLVGGTKIYSRPTEHKKWGVIILVFSIIGLGLFFLSIGTDWTGILGSLAAIMGIIGGILALVFKPSLSPQQPYAQTGYPPPPPQAAYQQQYQPPQQFGGVCPQCGRANEPGTRFCPNCGNPLT